MTGDIHYCTFAIRRRRCGLTIHDLCSPDRLKGRRKHIFPILWYSLPLRGAPYLTVISEETRRRLKRTFPATADKARVIPNCVDEAFSSKRRIPWHGTGKPRVLQVGTATSKNLERVAAAISGLPMRLRIIGGLSEEQRSLLQSRDIEWTSVERLADGEVVREYHGSEILIFVSAYEGFSVPIVGAQAGVLPVITSNMAPMSEVAGDGPIFVDPYDKEEICSALERLLNAPSLARRLSDQRRRNAERFDARTVADGCADIYKRICRGPGTF